MPKLVKTAVILGSAGTLSLACLTPAIAQPNGELSVFHAIPGQTVDVYANGKVLLSDFKPGTLTDSMNLRQGTYDIKIFPAGADQSGKPLLEKNVQVTDGSDATLVANLNQDGQPALNLFRDNTSDVLSGDARVTVRHVADAPAVDVRVNGKTTFRDLANPNQASTEIPAGTINTDVLLAGTDTVVLGPNEIAVPGATNTVIYAWGSADDGNLALKTQRLSD